MRVLDDEEISEIKTWGDLEDYVECFLDPLLYTVPDSFLPVKPGGREGVLPHLRRQRSGCS